ncbi:MAG: hypothetical protein R2755_17700 [Acidimicrobiales bacterium]
MELGRVVAVKTVGYHPRNPTRKGLPSVMATTSLYDTATGQLVALVDATLLTALRTGAASAVATEVLAVDGPLHVGVIGCGAQAVTQLHAVSRVRSIERITVLDTDPAVAASFGRRVAFLDRPPEVVERDGDLRLLADVDVLCTCTSVDVGKGPVLRDGPHRPWLHVNAVGADFPVSRSCRWPCSSGRCCAPTFPSSAVSRASRSGWRPSRSGPTWPRWCSSVPATRTTAAA